MCNTTSKGPRAIKESTTVTRHHDMTEATIDLVCTDCLDSVSHLDPSIQHPRWVKTFSISSTTWCAAQTSTEEFTLDKQISQLEDVCHTSSDHAPS